jgi:hypothetical protein
VVGLSDTNYRRVTLVLTFFGFRGNLADLVERRTLTKANAQSGTW